jgi:hypothetical protein
MMTKARHWHTTGNGHVYGPSQSGVTLDEYKQQCRKAYGSLNKVRFASGDFQDAVYELLYKPHGHPRAKFRKANPVPLAKGTKAKRRDNPAKKAKRSYIYDVEVEKAFGQYGNLWTRAHSYKTLASAKAGAKRIANFTGKRVRILKK